VKSSTLVLFVLLCSFCFGQVSDLDFLGQTPGGSAFNLTYDSAGQRLFVGCGASIWVYDASDPVHPVRTGMRPFRGPVNEMVLSDGVLFAAVSHGGVWALDPDSPTLEPFDLYETPGDTAAWDLWVYGDTLYVATGYDCRVLVYQSGFDEVKRFDGAGALAVSRRDTLVAVGRRDGLSGTVALYSVRNLAQQRSAFTHLNLLWLQDLQFADLRDDIIYVCGGTPNLGLTGVFYALQATQSGLEVADLYTIGGIPALAQSDIINLDSRNDTLFLATTAGMHQSQTTIPVLDATGLPEDTLKVIGNIRPGLWHFDVALFDTLPYMAIASEWYGLWINDISSLQPLDTIAVVPTGGWCQRCYVRGDTLWACMRGYGLVAYDIDSMLYGAGYVGRTELLRLPRAFTMDFTFVDDTTVALARSIGVDKLSLFNLGPWYRGGQAEWIDDIGAIGLSSAECVAAMMTDAGPRIVTGLVDGTLEVYDACGARELVYATQSGGRPRELMARGDTLLVGAVVEGDTGLAAFRLTGDSLVLLGFGQASGTVTKLAWDGGLAAAACEAQGAVLYRWQGDSLLPVWMTDSGNVVDVHLGPGLLYLADKLSGLRVYSVVNPDEPELVARNPGSGGWHGLFGSTAVTVGPGQRIFLSDFNSGVFVIEPARPGIEETMNDARRTPKSGPTVVRGVLRMVGSTSASSSTSWLLDAVGRRVTKLQPGENDISRLAPGVYFVREQSASSSQYSGRDASSVIKVVIQN